MLELRASDTSFTDSPHAGDPRCLCSRCGEPIPAGVLPIRFFDHDGVLEWRYHPACVGVRVVATGDEGESDVGP